MIDLAPSLLFAAAAGILTVLSPCALPVVPLVVGAGLAGGRARLAGIVLGFAATFVAASVLLASTLAAVGVTTSQLRILAAVLLAGLGATIAIPALGRWVAGWRILRFAADRVAQPGRPRGGGLVAGVALGGAIGVVWAPCAGPIMAAAIAASVAQGPTLDAVLVSLAYAVGASVPLLAIAAAGRRATRDLAPATWRTGLTRTFGAVTVVAALLVASGLDLRLQAALATVNAPSTADPAAASGTAATPAPVTLDPVLGADGNPLPAPLAETLPGPVPLDDLGPAPELAGITAWINAEPTTMASLRGKVVLVHFWTFACRNCLAVQPYVKAWAGRYADAGLVVIGVHTPELSFERDLDNVRAAVADQGVQFPVAFDPEFATWRAYANGAWPAFHYVDREGRVRFTRGGEGAYDLSEQVIRQLLAGS